MPDGGGPGGGTGAGEDPGSHNQSSSGTIVRYIPQIPEASLGSADDMLQQMMAMMMPFFQQMMGMTQSMMSMAAQPAIPAMPDIEIPEPIDFKEAEAELARRMLGQQAVIDSKKYGVTDSLHASLLLDEPETTDDSIAGGILI